MTATRARIREGSPVVDNLGRPVGDVERVVVGATSRGPRFLVVRGRIVPCEAIERADASGALGLRLQREHVDMLPRFEDRAPSVEEARHAYAMIGGLPGDAAGGEDAHTVPFEDSIPGGAPALRADEPLPPLEIDALIIIAAEDRERSGYRDEWLLGGGPGP